MSIRKSDYTVHPVFLNRWSPRSLTGEEISDEELFTLFEAARWAPSNYNSQPWRFFYAKRQTPEWELFYQLLVVMAARQNYEFDEKPNPTHSFDTGAAWMSLALQGFMRGWVVHGMSGFDYARAQEKLKIPKGYQVEAMAAIGRRASKELLSQEMQKDEAPSERRPLEEILFRGAFPS